MRGPMQHFIGMNLYTVNTALILGIIWISVLVTLWLVFVNPVIYGYMKSNDILFLLQHFIHIWLYKSNDIHFLLQHFIHIWLCEE